MRNDFNNYKEREERLKNWVKTGEKLRNGFVRCQRMTASLRPCFLYAK
jgi:hypothetical protein